MSLPATLYTLAAIGFFTLMVNRPNVDLTSSAEAMQPETSTESTESNNSASTEPSMSNTSTPAESNSTTDSSQTTAAPSN
ncbi:MAG: hypothetical protein E6Q83_09965 [Thiothrix sp.]|nr:MAG: hypothetical protein E6Q83_09965 [Thiothrix sp.]